MIKKRILLSSIIAVLCLSTYSNIFHNGFLIDDHILFEDSPKSLQDTVLTELFRHGHNFTYRPVGLYLLKCERLLFRDNPAGYHAVNLAIFSAICILIFLIFYKLLKDSTISFLTACLYAAHPINNFLLNYKTASNLSLFILSSFISTWFFVKLMHKEKIVWLMGSLLFYFISLLCHEAAFILPLYLLLIIYFFERKKLPRLACYTLSYFIPFAIFIWLRIASAASTKITGLFAAELPFFSMWNTFIKLVGWYLSKLFLPLDLLFMWEEKIAADTPFLLNLTILCGWALAVIYILRKKKKEIWGFGLVIFSAGFLPAFLASFSYTKLLKTALIESHWFGFSSAGFFLLVILGLSQLRKIFSKKVFWGVMVGLIALLASWTHYTNRFWKNDLTYCSRWIMLNSINATPWQELARRYVLENQNKPLPNCADLGNLGLMFHILRDVNKAYQCYTDALKADERCAAAYYGLGVLFTDTEQENAANEAFAKAKEIQPEYYEAYRLLAEIFVNQGEKDYGRRIKKMIGHANSITGHKLTGGWVY